MELMETFRKQGGMKLIKQYIKSGSLCTAIGEFLLLGKSRTALEILRLSTELKTRQMLERKYLSVLEAFDSRYDSSLPHVLSNKVWICWLQGMENAPEVVKQCYRSIERNLTDREIILITEKNLEQYVDFPEHIMRKWKAGIITHTHLTDLLRLELLIRHGGIWLDATVFCSSERDAIPEYYFNSDLFFHQALKPGRDGNGFYISSWLLSAKTNNKVLMATKEMCYEYWKSNNSMVNYYLLHIFMSIVLDHYPEDWSAVIPRDNAAPHIILLRLFDQFDERLWEATKAQTPFHKMTYKFDLKETEKENTFYKAIFEGADR